LTIELLREAGIRLPAPIGQTVGLVGGVITDGNRSSDIVSSHGHNHCDYNDYSLQYHNIALDWHSRDKVRGDDFPPF
jgi:hypothetical protein